MFFGYGSFQWENHQTQWGDFPSGILLPRSYYSIIVLKCVEGTKFKEPGSYAHPLCDIELLGMFS